MHSFESWHMSVSYSPGLDSLGRFGGNTYGQIRLVRHLLISSCIGRTCSGGFEKEQACPDVDLAILSVRSSPRDEAYSFRFLLRRASSATPVRIESSSIPY